MNNETNQETMTLSDDKNPRFLFDLTDTSLLMAIAKGDIDPVQLAKNELANRGLNQSGLWVGFEKAEKIAKLRS